MNVAGAGIAEYIKRAFLYRWNLLLFFGGATASVLTPWPDALLPLLMAAEVTYLGMLVSRPRFRDAIDDFDQGKFVRMGRDRYGRLHLHGDGVRVWRGIIIGLDWHAISKDHNFSGRGSDARAR